MSDVLLDFEKKSLEFQLKVTESPLSYIKQQCVQESRIALAIYIPYPILMKWHELVGIKDERGNELNYIDLLNFNGKQRNNRYADMYHKIYFLI